MLANAVELCYWFSVLEIGRVKKIYIQVFAFLIKIHVKTYEVRHLENEID